MKQVININFHGQVVPIEVSAYDLLKQYIESLNRFFAQEDGKEEIINDIESRIAELFQERLKKGATCITDDDVNAIIKSMGRPEEFEAEGSQPRFEQQSQQSQQQDNAAGQEAFKSKRLYRDENDKIIGGVCAGLANYFGIDVVIVRVIFVVLAISFGFGLIPYIILWVVSPSSSTKVIGSVRKKLYRDVDDKYIAGVCSGIANYFGISPWIPRVLFLLPFLTFVFGWSHWGNVDFPHFLRLSFSPGAFIIYVILWFVIPEAMTTAEKLEMKGEKVDLDSIKKSVVEELKGVQQRAEKLGAEAKKFASEKGNVMGTEIGGAAKRSGRSLGDIIVFLAKAFAYFVAGTVGLSLVIALFALAITAIGIFPIKNFFLTSDWQEAYAWGTLLFFIAVPVIGILIWIIRKITRVKSHSKFVRISFSALWVLGWASVTLLVASLSKEFRHSSTIVEEPVYLSNPLVNRLELSSEMSTGRYYRNKWFRIAPFENLDEDTAIVRNVNIKIVQSPNDSFKVTKVRMACGRTVEEANRQRNLIRYEAVQQDSLLLLDKGIAINKTNKFRNQWIYITVYVPVGKQIRINRNVGWGQNVHFDGFWDNDFSNVVLDDEQYGWNSDVTYTMRKEGLVDDRGKPADMDRYRRFHGGSDDYNSDNDNSNDNNKKGYRYNNSVSSPRIDSLKQTLDQEQKRFTDSLEKAAEESKKRLEEINEKLKKAKGVANNIPKKPVTIKLQSYHPFGLI